MAETKNDAPHKANALKSGKRRDRLILGTLPKQMVKISRFVMQYRRQLEAAVIDAKKEISMGDAHLIDALVKQEQHSQVCRWILRNRLEKMTPGEILDCSNAATKAVERRNACFQRLGLDQSTKSMADELYSDDNEAE